jgi:hypothetical protein
MTNTQTRTFIASRRRADDSTKLVEKLGYEYSQAHVCNVLAGRRNNSKILNTAYKMVSRRKATA